MCYSSPTWFVLETRQESNVGSSNSIYHSHGVMAADLQAVFEELNVNSDNRQDIDDYLFEHRPKKRAKISNEELKKQLEEEFLKPSYNFSTEWLNKLQS